MRKFNLGPFLPSQSQAAFLMSTGLPSGMLASELRSALVESPLWMQMLRIPGCSLSSASYLLEVIVSNIGYATLPSSSLQRAISESGLLSILALFAEV